MKDHRSFAQCTEMLAWVAEKEGRHERAACLLAIADNSWRTMGTSLKGLAPVVAFHDECGAGVRGALGETEYRDAQAQATALSHSQAVDYAMEESATGAALERPEPGPALLTRRETQVAGLVGQGLSNKDIAARLVISPRTVEAHVDHILTKLGHTSRAQIAAWAALHCPDSAR